MRISYKILAGALVLIFCLFLYFRQDHPSTPPAVLTTPAETEKIMQSIRKAPLSAQAEKMMEQFSVNDPNRKKFVEAYVLYEHGLYDQSLSEIFEVLRSDTFYFSLRPVTNLIQNLVARKQGEIDEALLDQKPVLPLRYKEWIEHLVAHQLFANKKYEKALMWTDRALAFPANEESSKKMWLLKASIYEKMNALKKEEGVLREFIYLFPRDLYSYQAHLRLEKIYAIKGDYSAQSQEQKILLGSPIFLKILLWFTLPGLAFIIGVITLVLKGICRKKAGEKPLMVFRWLDFYFGLLLSILFSWAVNILMARHFAGLFGTNTILLSMIFADICFAGFCLYLLKRKYGFDNTILGFISKGYKFNFLLPLTMVGGSVLCAAVFGLIFHFLGIHMPHSMLTYAIKNAVAHGGFAFALLAVGIIGPLTEEIIFRVYLYNFIKYHSGVKAAMIISSILFSLAHEKAVLIPYYLCIGFLLSYTYEKTKTIFPSMVAHCLFNSLIVAAAFFLNH